jgi:flagellar protein FlbD
MIKPSRINKQEFYLNSDLIETMEMTPDTVITLVNGKKVIASESAEEIVDMITKFRGKIQNITQIE